MFGNFNLNAGLSQLQDLGGRFQKIKEDLEQNIESSLRTNVAPAPGNNLDQDTSNITTSADGTVAFGGTLHCYESKSCCTHALQAFCVAFDAVRLDSRCKRGCISQTHVGTHADSWEGYSLGTAPAKAPSSEVLRCAARMQCMLPLQTS